MGLTITQVDAFTSKPFAGNPAAVCILPEEKDDQWLQNVAREMNLSETAFLLQQNDGYQLRWFTPAVEVDLCGHATLASAHVLWESGTVPLDAPIRFQTRSGLLLAQRRGTWIELDFPVDEVQPATTPAGLLASLNVSAEFVGKGRFDYLIEVASEEIVKQLQPDFTRLSTVEARGVIVTSQANEGKGYDFVSRFFGPAVGVNEDPVTGSAHCSLAPYWTHKLQRPELIGYQASARGGIVQVHMKGKRVLLRGQAVTVVRGELLY